jgi:aspartate aminotransferase
MNLKLNSPSIFIGKQSKEIISFGSGQPDLPPPKEAYINLKPRKDMRYGLIKGESKLRVKLSEEYPNSNPEDFIITNGASEALDLVFRSLKNKKIILPKPYYYSYPHAMNLAGVTPVYTELNNGRIELDDFNKKIEKCDGIIINSPSNPTGRVESIKTLKEIEKITRDLNKIIISDEVYKNIIYNRKNYLLKGEHVITINSFSKTYCLCGARVGYLWSSDSNLINSCVNIKTHTSMNTSLLSQDMALNAMNTPPEYIRNQLKIWKERRDLITKELINLGLELWIPEGAFYVFPKIDQPRKFVKKLFLKYKTIAYLGEWFGDPQRVRFSYALDKEKIIEGVDKIRKCLNDID